MNAITTFGLSGSQLALVKNTIAKDCNPEEFSLFMEAAKSYGLDPFRKQILPMVFGKNARDQSKRRLSIIVARDGLRVIAQLCKNYRPASEKAEWEIDAALVGPLNPKGLVSCTVCLWQQDARGEWFKVKGEAEWDEFAPIAEEWAEDDTGKRRPTGKKTLDASGNWVKMPKVMLEKCFDGETEVLTASGFQRFHDVTAPIMQVTEAGLEPVEAQPFRQPYDGPMIALESDDLNFVVTPNHDMITTAGKIEAGAMYEGARARPMFHVPRHPPGRAIDADISDQAVRLTAAYLADGYDRVSGYAIAVSRPRKVEALRALGGFRSEDTLPDAGNVAHAAGRDIVTKSDKTRFEYDAGTLEGLASPGKLIDLSLLTSLSARQSRLFVDTLVDFDGHTQAKSGVRRFYSSRPDLIAAFELAAVMAGYAVSDRKARTSDISDRENYYVTISPRNAIGVIRWGRDYNSLSTENAKGRTGLTMRPNEGGEVWCVTVPSGAIVVRRHGFSMLCGNCAEAQALRAGWPEQFGGLYAEEEMDRAKAIDLTATEIVAAEEEDHRLRLLGAIGDSITVTWGDGWKLEDVPIGQFFDRAAEFVSQSDAALVARWAEANQIGLNRFWAKSKTDALALKKLVEEKTAQRAAA